MELNEQITALTSENKQYKDFLEKTNAEKIALDQLLVETLKSSLIAKTENILKDEKIKKLNTDIQVLKNEKEILEKKVLEITPEISEIIS